MNIGGSYELDGRLLQLSCQSSKLAGDLGRDLHAHEDAHLRDWNNVPTRSLGIDFVRRHIYPDAEFLNEVIVALTGLLLPGDPCQGAVSERLERHHQYIPRRL
jgi:hypothetical protein